MLTSASDLQQYSDTELGQVLAELEGVLRICHEGVPDISNYVSSILKYAALIAGELQSRSEQNRCSRQIA
jgi:hypothetical protein